ncbi:MAG: hypothetical protein L6R41_000423 [Letrouitia leprolyta]|nr:MAG: hypothetical protein L6R41_000423 [Letrouitia leprolyta]
MGKPRLIILIRHAQSEGNKNRDIHQTVPDHRVKLTSEGWKQAEAAGQKLRSLLRPDDTLHFFTSPYRHPAPSPFPRHTIKVYEEPRLREQDFGNFQPGSQEMARMWAERADYGHFFYRIPNGESAADAYDRVSGFNDTLWRSFGDDDFASVCVLVTHGLMTRVFLMKWYHFSVEYFEDLRNVDHCEFVVMKRSQENQKYILQNELRTWSQMRKERSEPKEPESPIPVRKKWAGFQDGYEATSGRRQARRQNTADMFADDVDTAQQDGEVNATRQNGKPRGTVAASDPTDDRRSSTTLLPESSLNSVSMKQRPSPQRLRVLEEGRDGGGSRSGAPSQCGSDTSDDSRQPSHKSMAMALHGTLEGKSPQRARADALGDQSDVDDDVAP